ncbi:MAG: succinate dehydrogenase [Paracoccaceae bacterium]
MSAPRPTRTRGVGYWAAILHRVSGIALALFLPLHFLVLGLAIEGQAALDGFLALSDLVVVKIAEWLLVALFGLHFALGLRILVIELVPWRRGAPVGGPLVYASLGASAVIGALFLGVAFS